MEKFHHFTISYLQAPSLQVSVSTLSSELTLSQLALQDRVLVFVPSPQVLLQVDQETHVENFGEP